MSFNSDNLSAKAHKSQQSSIFYLVVSAEEHPEPHQGNVFYKSNDEKVAQILCNLFVKEYGNIKGKQCFSVVSLGDDSVEDQVLIDEALVYLDVYGDPDRGIYDPPPPKDLWERAQFSQRAVEWETTIRTKLSTQPQSDLQGDARSRVPEPPFSDSEELNVVYADAKLCLQKLETLSRHYNLLSSLEQEGKVGRVAGAGDYRMYGDLKEKVSAEVFAMNKPLARVWSWAHHQFLKPSFDGSELTSEIPNSWWDGNNNESGFYEYYEFICDQYKLELNNILKNLAIVANKDSVACIVSDSYLADAPIVMAEVSHLTLEERKIVLEVMEKALFRYSPKFRVLYEAHLKPAELILFRQQRDAFREQFEEWKLCGCKGDGDKNFQAMLKAEDIVRRVVAMRDSGERLQSVEQQLVNSCQEQDNPRDQIVAHDSINSSTEVEGSQVVVLGEKGMPCKVLNVDKPKLTAAQYEVVEALLDAGEEGLTKDALETVRPSARRILNELKKDPEWDEVILMAGQTNGRYRIKS